VDNSTISTRKKIMFEKTFETIISVEQNNLMSEQLNILKRGENLLQEWLEYEEELYDEGFGKKRKKTPVSESGDNYDVESEIDQEDVFFESVLEFWGHLNAAKRFVTERNKPRCSSDIEMHFEKAKREVGNMEAKLEAFKNGNTKMRTKFLNGFHLVFLQNFGKKEDLKAKRNFKTPSKKCFIEWGRELLDDVFNKKYLAIAEGIERPEDCEGPCSQIEACTAWTFDKKDNFCYLKTASMATRYSEVWDSNVWSGRLIYCSTNLDIEWTRVCQKERYLSCIKDIMDEEGIKNVTRTVPRVLNDISDEDRAKFDTLNSEFNCLDEFCPWTPTDTIKGQVEVSEYLKKQLDVGGGKVYSTDSDRIMYSTDLRETTNGYLESDVSIYTQAVFRQEVFNKMTSEQKIRMIFELKEKGLADMEKAWKLSIEENMPLSRKKRGLGGLHTSKSNQLKLDISPSFETKHVIERYKTNSVGDIDPIPPQETDDYLTLMRGRPAELQKLVEKRRKQEEKKLKGPNTFIVVDSRKRFRESIANSENMLSHPVDLGEETVNGKKKKQLAYVPADDYVQRTVQYDPNNPARNGFTDTTGPIALGINPGNTPIIQHFQGRPYHMTSQQWESRMQQSQMSQSSPSQSSGGRGLTSMGSDHSEKLQNRRKMKKIVRKVITDLNQASELKTGVANNNNYVKEKRKFAQKFKKKAGGAGDKLGAAGDAIDAGVGLYNAIKYGDEFGIASSVLGLVAVGAAFAGPPVGTIVSAVAGIAATLVSLFAPSGPSDVEIIGDMIQDQTEQIGLMMEDQTKILLKALNQLGEQNRKLAEFTVTEILKDNYYQMIDDMKGVTASLKIKKEHLDIYQDSCITQWPEISVESDMNQINFQMGRFGAFLQRFCLFRGRHNLQNMIFIFYFNSENMEFCGRLLLEYSLLSTLRNTVRAATLHVVERSGFHNREYKRGGLIKEHYKTLELDRNILKEVVSNSSLESPYCHVTCAIRGAKNNLQSYWDEKTFDENTLNLKKDEKEFVLKFLSQLGISLYIPEMQLGDCSRCYQRGVGCKDEDRSRGVKAIRKRGKDGTCEETLTCEEKGWKYFDNSCYKFFSDKRNYWDAQNYCNWKKATLTSVRSLEEINFLKDLSGGEAVLTAGKRNCSRGEGEGKQAFPLDIQEIQATAIQPLVISQIISSIKLKPVCSFRWDDGSETPVDDNLWYSNQPDNAAGDEDCVELDSVDGRLNDIGCNDYERKFVCRKS